METFDRDISKEIINKLKKENKEFYDLMLEVREWSSKAIAASTQDGQYWKIKIHDDHLYFQKLTKEDIYSHYNK